MYFQKRPFCLSAFLEGYALPVPEIKLFESPMYPQTNNMSACSADAYAIYFEEANLDIQSITSYGSGADFGFIPIGNPENLIYIANLATEQEFAYEIFVLYREIFIENDVAPDVLSLSWGSVLTSFPRDLDNILEEFTAAGITVLMASGMIKPLKYLLFIRINDDFRILTSLTLNVLFFF
jgi:hypothetical protein